MSSTSSQESVQSCGFCSQHQNEIESLKVKLNTSAKVAYSAMRGASQLGSIFTFMEHAENIKNFEELAKSTLAVAQEFSVRVIVQIRNTENLITLADHGEVTPTQLELFAIAQDKGRILEWKDIILFNDVHVSLLSFELPTDDPAECGRLRDILIQLVSAAESRYRSIMVESMLRDQSHHASQIIDLIRQISSDNHTHASAIIKSLVNDLQAAIATLELTEEQEIHFTKLGESGIEQLDSLLSNSHLVEEHIAEVLNGLRRAVDMAAFS